MLQTKAKHIKTMKKYTQTCRRANNQLKKNKKKANYIKPLKVKVVIDVYELFAVPQKRHFSYRFHNK